MLNLPKSTEMKKQLSKSAIYSKFNMNNEMKEKFDSDIKRMSIVHELSPATLPITKSEDIGGIFVVHVLLKQKDFDEKNISMISKLIQQKMLFILEYEHEQKLAIYHGKLMLQPWKEASLTTVSLNGLDLKQIWENFIVQVGGIRIEHGNTLDVQITINEKRQKLLKQIESLEKQARTEKQPKMKFELVEKIKRLKTELTQITPEEDKHNG